MVALLLVDASSGEGASVVRLNPVGSLVVLDLLILEALVNTDYLVLVGAILLVLGVRLQVLALLTASLRLYLGLLVKQLFGDSCEVSVVLHVAVILLIYLILRISLTPIWFDLVAGLRFHK